MRWRQGPTAGGAVYEAPVPDVPMRAGGAVSAGLAWLGWAGLGSRLASLLDFGLIWLSA